MWFLVILNAPPKMIPLIRQKSFLEKTKKGGWARDVTNRGGVRGGIPPGIHMYHHHLQKPERSCFHLCIAQKYFGDATYLRTIFQIRGFLCLPDHHPAYRPARPADLISFLFPLFTHHTTNLTSSSGFSI